MNLTLLTLESIADINFNIIVKIYKLLDFVDQLRFAQSSPWLKQIFRAKIWTPSYKTLKVDSLGDDLALVLVAAPIFFNVCEINGKRICLNREEFTEFLALYANEVTELMACENYFPDIRNFKNITSLKSTTGENVKQHLQMVTDNCPNLQSFEVRRHDIIRVKIDVDYLFKLRHLKILSLECGFIIQYEQFCGIIRNLNLKSLRISDIEVNVQDIIRVETPKFLTDLHISISDSRLLGWNFNIFENLLTLYLYCETTINANDWNIFCAAARRLEVITMRCLEMPKTMEIINLPNSLKQVNIEICGNLTDKHLIQILNLPNLLKFSLADFIIRPLNYELPPQLRSLNYDCFDTFDLLTSVENNQNLEELTWYNHKEKSLLNQDNRLLFCKSLKTLNVECGTLASDIILRLQNLCKLSLCQRAVFKWSDVIALIKHPVLKELYIFTYKYPEIQDEMSVSELVEGFPIHLRVLCIPSTALSLNLNFWLDLLCQNLSRLKLIVDWVRREYLKEIVGNKKFPKRAVSTITYGNYIVDCKTLQIKFHDEDSAAVPILSSDYVRTLVLCKN